MQGKQNLRHHMSELRNAQSNEDVEKKSLLLSQKIRKHDCYKKATNIASYISCNKEIDLGLLHGHIFKENKKLFLPKFFKNTYVLAEVRDLYKDLMPGKFGISEPTDSCRILLPEQQNNIDLWLIPALAFSLKGDRLGRGGGYYDRLLEHARGYKLGVGYDFQRVTELQSDNHDVAMNELLLIQLPS